MDQPSLLAEPPLPGLFYRADMLEAAEHDQLLGQIQALAFTPFAFHGWLGKRRVVSFGWRYDFNEAELAEAPPLPAFLEPLRMRAATLAGLRPEELVHAMVTEYAPGAGIGWHRDRPVFDKVIGISLASACTLRFRRRRPGGFDRAALVLVPGSAYALTGEARQAWEHSIAPMEALRYSVTFRSFPTASRRQAVPQRK